MARQTMWREISRKRPFQSLPRDLYGKYYYDLHYAIKCCVKSAIFVQKSKIDVLPLIEQNNIMAKNAIFLTCTSSSTYV